jgi:hypothetical protein
MAGFFITEERYLQPWHGAGPAEQGTLKMLDKVQKKMSIVYVQM